MNYVTFSLHIRLMNILGGDELNEFEKLYKLYFIEIYNYILKLSKDNYMSEDIVQEAFVRAYEYTIVHKNVLTKQWFYKVSYNIFIDKIRKLKRIDLNNEFEEFLSVICSPEEEFSKKEESQKIQYILDKLPLDYKNILILREFKELTYEEIAEVLNISVDNVKVKLFRARQKFKSKYKEFESI